MDSLFNASKLLSAVYSALDLFHFERIALLMALAKFLQSP
jgi:hypothetical protein